MKWFYLGGGQYIDLMDIKECMYPSFRLGSNEWITLSEDDATFVLECLEEFRVRPERR